MNLEELVKDFLVADWHYEFSDDYSVYSKGRLQVESIQTRFKEIEWSSDIIQSFIQKVTDTINDWYPSVDNSRYIESMVIRIKKMVGN